MGSVFGGSQTTKTDVPKYLKEPIKDMLGRAEDVSRIGYTPYYGPDVAAFTPMQEAAFAGTNAAAGAFGMPTAASSMPEAQTFAGGMRGYSSAPMYEQAVAELKTRNPEQYARIMSQFGGASAQGASMGGEQGGGWVDDFLSGVIRKQTMGSGK